MHNQGKRHTIGISREVQTLESLYSSTRDSFSKLNVPMVFVNAYIKCVCTIIDSLVFRFITRIPTLIKSYIVGPSVIDY